jgi:processed acidic surface protein
MTYFDMIRAKVLFLYKKNYIEGEKMEIKNVLKKGSLVAALGLGLSFAAVAPGNSALAASNTDPQAQKLVDSLKALNLDNVDYLYTYLQSVNLSTAEFNGITANVNEVNKILTGKSASDLSGADRTSVANLFLDSVKLAHLQASIVDDKGNAISLETLASYKAGTTGIKIELKDLNGNVLATVDPTGADLQASVLQTKIEALKSAVQAKRSLEASGKFVPMPAGTLPNTAGNNVDYMMLGGLLILIGGIAIVPAARLVRKSDALA